MYKHQVLWLPEHNVYEEVGDPLVEPMLVGWEDQEEDIGLFPIIRLLDQRTIQPIQLTGNAVLLVNEHDFLNLDQTDPFPNLIASDVLKRFSSVRESAIRMLFGPAVVLQSDIDQYWWYSIPTHDDVVNFAFGMYRRARQLNPGFGRQVMVPEGFEKIVHPLMG